MTNGVLLIIVLSYSGEEPHKLEPHPYRSMRRQWTGLDQFITLARTELGAYEARYTRCNFPAEWPVSETTVVGRGFLNN